MALSALTGTRLRERRLALGLRQADLAGRVGISASYLNLIEHNRRRISDELLGDLAAVLGVPLSSLQEGHSDKLMEALRGAAAAAPAAGAEVERAEEFAGRFPGWSALVADLQARATGLARVVEVLNDRITHDPHLSASLHEILNATASVRSTAAILADTEDIDPDWRARFHRNLATDSERLAHGAEALVAYLDSAAEGTEQSLASPQEEVEAWAEAVEWNLTAPMAHDGAGRLSSPAARSLAREMQDQAAADAISLPDEALKPATATTAPDPLALAARFGVPVLTVFRRLALRPGAPGGLLMCDGSGTLTLRKPVLGFSPPRYGAACPLLPLFSALSRPETPVEAIISLPGPLGARFRVLAFCQRSHPAGFRGPELREAGMLLIPEPIGAEPAQEVGPTCRICPRTDCPARREPSILSL